jgi:hypothetical protein
MSPSGLSKLTDAAMPKARQQGAQPANGGGHAHPQADLAPQEVGDLGGQGEDDPVDAHLDEQILPGGYS